MLLGWGIVPCYTVLSLVLLVTIIHHFSREWREEDEAVAHSYDFIIVGGGTTGAVVAARLSEEASVSVLLVEAGGDGNLLSKVPMLSTLQFNGDMDWAYKTKSDGKSCLGMVGGECNWHRGKVIGGTSVLNALIYNRGK
jgi:glucose dehydrogenase (acceptor)